MAPTAATCHDTRRSEHRSRKTNALNLGVWGRAPAGDHRPVRPKASWSGFFCDSLTLSHGVYSVNDYGIGIVDDAVANGVCEDRVAELSVPAADVELGAEDGRGFLVPGFYDLQQIPGFRLLQREQKPLVQDQQFDLLVLLHDLPVRTVVPIDVEYKDHTIEIYSEYDNVNTTLAYQDIFNSEQPIRMQNNFLFVDKGTTVITYSYPYLSAGILLTIFGLSGEALVLWFLFKKSKKLNSIQNDKVV